MVCSKDILTTIIALAVGMNIVGCESFTGGTLASKKKKDASWFSFKKKEYQTPQSVNVTWTHDVLTLPGKPPTRGFGGRFYFYNEKTQAIPVDGELVVYGFDDTFKTNGTEDLNQADKRFKFTAEQFTTHFTEGELGASYSVWIPWDEANGYQKKIMLIPTFLTKDGKLIRGAPANLNLPGKGNEANQGFVQQTSALMPANNGPSNIQPSTTAGTNSGLRTTTIQVPSNSLRRQHDSPDVAAALATIQNQQLQQANNLAMNGYAASNPSYAPNANTFSQPSANQTEMNMSVQPTLASGPIMLNANQNASNGLQPQAMIPAVRYNAANGLAMPGYAPVTLSGQPVHSLPNLPQAQALQAAQPSSFQSR